MPLRKLTNAETDFLAGATGVAAIPVLDEPRGTAVEILSAGDGFVVAVVGPDRAHGEVLGTGDDLLPLLKLASALAHEYHLPSATDHRDALARPSRPVAPEAGDWEISPAQVAALEAYADGEYAWLVDVAREGGAAAFDRAMAELDDGLLRYVARELDAREGCDEAGHEAETAHARMGSLIDDLMAIQAAVDDVSATPGPGA